jgi:hypothetical protein
MFHQGRCFAGFVEGHSAQAPDVQFGFAQNSSTPAASLPWAHERALLVAKATGPWTPLIAGPCIPTQGAAGVALVKYPG